MNSDINRMKWRFMLRTFRGDDTLTRLGMRSIPFLVLVEIVSYIVVSLYSPSSYGYLGFSAFALGDGRPWTLLTSLFVHVNVIHLALDMFLLLSFGSVLEAEEGSVRTLLAFFGGGAGSLLLGIPFYPNGEIIVGSSVGVSAVAGATLLMKPNRVMPWYRFRAPVGLVAAMYIVFNLFLAWTDTGNLIAYPSHVIGFLVGVSLYALFSRADRSPRPSGQAQESARPKSTKYNSQ